MASVTVQEVEDLFRPLSSDEKRRAEKLIPVVLATLQMEAEKVGKDLDDMLAEGELLDPVLTSVVTDVVSRTLLTSTTAEPMTQITQSALGYSTSGTYLVPGGGLFIKKSELSRLGLRRQRMRMVDIRGSD